MTTTATFWWLSARRSSNMDASLATTCALSPPDARVSVDRSDSNALTLSLQSVSLGASEIQRLRACRP